MRRAIFIFIVLTMVSVMPMTAFAAQSVKTPARVTLKSVTSDSDAQTVTVTWKRLPENVTAYQIEEKVRWSNGKSQKWEKLQTVSRKTTSLTLKKYSSGKYSYRVRAINKRKTDDGYQTKKGDWSKTKSTDYTMKVVQIYQSTPALEPFTFAGFSTIDNPNHMRGYGYSGTSRQDYDSVTDDPKMEFRSLVYTPSIPNPQGMTVDPEGNTAWVMSSYKGGADNSRKGRIYRVDLSKYWGQDAKGDENGSVTEGPMIVTGHGQTLSYNPVTKELWYVRAVNVHSTTFVQVDPESLDVVKEIHCTFSNKTVTPPAFCFDIHGNAWMYIRSSGGRYVPRNAVRFYKGKIENDHVSFTMQMRGLRYPAGSGCQGFGYDPGTDLLYVASDGQMVGVPAGKLDTATAEDVKTVTFTKSPSREFEGIAFSEEGCAFFLTNKRCEIMRDRVSYEKAMKEKERVQKVRAKYKKNQNDLNEKKDEELETLVIDQIGEKLRAGD